MGRDPEDIQSQPPFTVQVVHEQTEDHQMAIYVRRDVTQDGVTWHQWRIGLHDWVDEATPICWLPCEVWNKLVDFNVAAALLDVSEFLVAQSQLLGPVEIEGL